MSLKQIILSPTYSSIYNKWYICLFCIGPIHQRKYNPARALYNVGLLDMLLTSIITPLENVTQLKQVQRRAARYVTNLYHNTSSVSNMIEHLNWRSLADRRWGARLVMLYKISHELVAIPKKDILIPPFRFSRNMHSFSYHHLDSPGTCTHSHTKYHQQAYNSDSNLSFGKQYETGTVSPWTLWIMTLLSHTNQLSLSLTTSSSKTRIYSFILKSF